MANKVGSIIDFNDFGSICEATTYASISMYQKPHENVALEWDIDVAGVPQASEVLKFVEMQTTKIHR